MRLLDCFENDLDSDKSRGKQVSRLYPWRNRPRLWITFALFAKDPILAQAALVFAILGDQPPLRTPWSDSACFIYLRIASLQSENSRASSLTDRPFVPTRLSAGELRHGFGARVLGISFLASFLSKHTLLNPVKFSTDPRGLRLPGLRGHSG